MKASRRLFVGLFVSFALMSCSDAANLDRVNTASTEICGDGIDNDENGDTDCDDRACADSPVCPSVQSNGTTNNVSGNSSNGGEVTVEALYEFPITGDLPIPDADPAGVSISLTISDQATVSDFYLGVGIRHTLASDLSLTLTAPDGSNYPVLSDYSGLTDLIGNELVSELRGTQLAGTWTLTVVDNVGLDTGSLVSAAIGVNFLEPPVQDNSDAGNSGGSEIHGCSYDTATDLREQGSLVVTNLVPWTIGHFACVIISRNTVVGFEGDFGAHPIFGGMDAEPDSGSPIQNPGAGSGEAIFMFENAGVFPYFCGIHSETMRGVIYVD